MDKTGRGETDRSEQTAVAEGPACKRGLLMRLYIFVFVSGTVLMSLEIAGSRLLAPHFGNSVFVWGSLITIFLASLSLGYFVGGILADRGPSFRALMILSVLVGGLVSLIPWIGHPLCRALLDLGMEEQFGPLTASMMLFLPPSFLLGMVSPYAVRLASRSVSSVGRTAGNLYAFSTIGSILGTLLTTFLLIPQVGVSVIFKLQAAIMLLFSLLFIGGQRRSFVLAIALLPALAMLLPASPSRLAEPGEKLIVETQSAYQDIRVVDYPARRARLLLCDDHVQGGIELYPPYRSLVGYSYYFHLAFLLKPHIRSALFIGAGAGIGPADFAAMDPAMTIDVVDIDQKVLDIARSHFYMPASARIRPVTADGRIFVWNADKRYDVIIWDVSTGRGRIPFHLTTREFFQRCRQILAADGVFIMNVISALEGERAEILHAILPTLRSVFPATQLFVKHYSRDRNPRLTRNLFLVATPRSRGLSSEEWRARAERYTAKNYVTKDIMQTMSQELYEPLPQWRETWPMTDDLAPVDTLR